jgi:ribosome biogenesis GTP-binding protein YlqF
MTSARRVGAASLHRRAVVAAARRARPRVVEDVMLLGRSAARALPIPRAPRRAVAHAVRASAARHQSQHSSTSTIGAVSDRRVEDAESFDAKRIASAGHVRLVQWYPGHIARAERLLKEQLKGVDAVLEVRDCRLPLSTSHPEIGNWCGEKMRIVVLNRADMVSDKERAKWVNYLKSTGDVRVVLTDARAGKGVKKVKEMAMEVSEEINAKRKAKGLLPRPVRAAVVGYPNVGKSALINRLVGKAACASAPRPGVTRDLRWVRIGGDLDLLDAPGVLPARMHDQRAASRLAMANDIGEASYIASVMASAMIEELKRLPTWRSIKPGIVKRFKEERVDEMSGEEFVQRFADKTCGGDVERAGTRMLNDFRGGHIGNFCLELPPERD